MKNKTTTAALLSILVMAGLAVTDAYAQSNTVRLENIDETTQDILEDTEGIAGALESLTDMLTAIQTSLDSLTTSLSDMMSSITGVQNTVNDVNTKVTSMETAVYDTQSSVSSVETAVGSMSTNVDTINSKIVGVDTLLQNVADLDTRLAGIEGGITDLERAVLSMDGGDDKTSDTLSVLAGTVVSNTGKLDEVLQRLAAIEVGLQQVNIDVKDISTAPSRPGNILLDGETERNVNSYDYKQYGDANTDTVGRYYELEMTFSCSADIFLDRVYLIHDGDSGATGNQYERYFGLSVTQDETKDANRHKTHNFVTVDGRDLFDTHFRFSSTTDTAAGQTYDLEAPFNREPLKAGDTLRFESQVYERGTNIAYDKNGNTRTYDPTVKMINAANRTYSLPFFEVNVDWFTYNTDTTCSIGFGTSGVTSPGLTKTNTLTYGVTTDPAHDGRSLKDFSNTINCRGEPVEITAISVDTADDWRLAGFVNVNLEYGTSKHTLAFDPDASDAVITNADFLPIYLGNDELKISGSIPLDNLLISLTYNSQPDTECKAPSKHDP